VLFVVERLQQVRKATVCHEVSCLLCPIKRGAGF